MNPNAFLRYALLEWSRANAAGELEDDLDWVDPTIFASALPYTMVRTRRGIRFRHIPFGAFLPGPMVDEARGAQASGQVTMLEAMQLLFARAEWLIAARKHYYTPYGPVPPLLAGLVEAYGVDAEIHRNHPETLSRAIAHLPAWYPHRGDPERLGDLIDEALGLPVDISLDQTTPEAGTEIFTIRSARWHAQRRTAASPLIIQGGLVHIQPSAPDSPHTEDVVVGWVEGQRFPHQLLRLLPTWASVRIHGASGS